MQHAERFFGKEARVALAMVQLIRPASCLYEESRTEVAMHKIGGYIVECLVEEYRDGWRAILRLFRHWPTSHRREAAVQYSVPALFPAKSAAERAAFLWARR